MYKQVAKPDETETIVAIDYLDKEFKIWTNRATVMNRLVKLGYKPTGTGTIDGEVYNLEFTFPTKMIGQFMRTGIFKYD